MLSNTNNIDMLSMVSSSPKANTLSLNQEFSSTYKAKKQESSLIESDINENSLQMDSIE